MVVWLFAGGGESEVKGYVLFLRKHFSGCEFSRKTPSRYKPGTRLNNKPSTYGLNKKSFTNEIKKQFKSAINDPKDKCDLILVIDDLDCRDATKLEREFIDTIDSVQGSEEIERFVGFAAPELESWIIADWDNSIGRHPDFRSRGDSMKHWLINEKDIDFSQPESFSKYNIENDSCEDKLSEAIKEATIKEASKQQVNNNIYSKGRHTPDLIMEIDPNIVKNKCPLFNKLYNFLNSHCSNN
jgi:hypothetical protein